MRRVGLAFEGQPYSVREILAATQAAEALGYESVWLAEDLWTGRDVISILSCLALSTERIGLGTCLIGAYTRHPVLIAMTLNTLSELAAGRLVLGIGAGMLWRPLVEAAIAQWPPLRAMRETVGVVRSLLSGEEVTWGEETVSLTVSHKCFSGALAPETRGVPIYMGAVGPRMTALVGEIGDGLLFGLGTRRDEIPLRLERLAVGAKRAHRDPNSIDIAKLILVSASDSGKIHDNALGYAARCVAGLDESEVQRLGFDPERVRRVRGEVDQDNCQAAYRLLLPEMISTFIAAGTPSECLRIIEEFVQPGVDLPILMAFGGDVNAVIEIGAEYANRSCEYEG